MKFTKQELDSFIALYKREFGENIDRAEAQEKATALVSIVELTYTEMTEKELKKHLEACRKRQIC